MTHYVFQSLHKHASKITPNGASSLPSSTQLLKRCPPAVRPDATTPLSSASIINYNTRAIGSAVRATQPNPRRRPMFVSKTPNSIVIGPLHNGPFHLAATSSYHSVTHANRPVPTEPFVHHPQPYSPPINSDPPLPPFARAPGITSLSNARTSW